MRAAYSRTLTNGEIYNDTMTETMRIESAKRTALDFFEAAGCELNATRTAIIAFPEGMERTRFEIFITGSRHPSHLLLAMASDTLQAMNIHITIREFDSQAEMFQRVMRGEADMWCAAWHSGVLPELGKNFYSAGTGNIFGLGCEIVDSRIALAYTGLDAAQYRSVMDAVLDRAVIVPVYQRKVYYIFGGNLDHATIADDLSVHYSYTEILKNIRVGG
jgi:hypothetical protein